MSSENLDSLQYKRLRATLIDAYDDRSLALTIRLALGKRPGQLSLRSTPIADAVDDLIEHLDRTSQWAAFLEESKLKDNASPALIKLCDDMMPLLTLAAVAGAAAKPVEELYLLGKVPFADRADVRDVISDMGMDSGWRGLVVDGPELVGKSYCLYLLNYVRQKQWGKDRLFHVVLKDEASADMSALALANRLRTDLHLDGVDTGMAYPATQFGQTDDAWVIDLGGWIVSAIEILGVRAWIVLDGFDNPAVPDLTHQLIRRLAHLAANSSKVRLVLIGYRGPLPETTKFLFKGVTLTYLSADHLQDFLHRLKDQWGCHGKAECQEALAAFEHFIRRYRATPPNVRALHELLDRALTQLVRALFDIAVPREGV